jgi:putative ABC transport system substrate-binding protein
MSYGVTYNEEFQQAATQVDKILRGAKPGDQPVEQPWRIPLSINMSTLRALGLTLPSTFLLQVNDVIQ